jgi:Ca2+:H+ antiporter
MDYQRLSPGNASPSYSAQKLRAIEGVLRSNYLYSLLIFVPLGIFFGTLGANPTIVFVFNMLAIVPLAMLLSFGTEELSANSGQAVGELLNASFGNAVEMIVSWIQGPSKICC